MIHGVDFAKIFTTNMLFFPYGGLTFQTEEGKKESIKGVMGETHVHTPCSV